MDSAAHLCPHVAGVLLRDVRAAVSNPLRGDLPSRTEEVCASSRPSGAPRCAVPPAAAPRSRIPTAGYRNGGGVNNVGGNGNYWSSSPNGVDNARNVNFNSGNVNPQNNNNRLNGFSVRLARVSIVYVMAAALLLPPVLSFLFTGHGACVAAAVAVMPVAGPWSVPRRTCQVPFEESMGADRYAFALREERCTEEQRAYLEKFLYRSLFRSYERARESNRNCYGQVEFESNLFVEIDSLKWDLLDGTYWPRRCKVFIVSLPVKREVIAPAFRDEVVDHLLYDYLYPIFDALFIYDSYSCRLGKGTSLGIDRLEHHILSVSQNYTLPSLVLCYDLAGYFMSIDHRYLYDQVMGKLIRKGHRRDVLYPLMAFLVRMVIFTDPTVNCKVIGRASDWVGLPANKSYFNAKPGKGLPIGRLPCQLFSNINLMEYDDYLKRDLRVTHMGHYVDDYAAVLRSSREASDIIDASRSFLAEGPKLTVHPHKVRVLDVRKGVPFLGVVLRPGRRCLSLRAQTLMAEKYGELLATEEDVFHEDASRASVRGHLLDKRNVRMEALSLSRPW